MVNLTAPSGPSDEELVEDGNGAVAPGFPARFKHARRRASMTLAQVAEATDIPLSTIEAWSSGKRSPSLGPRLVRLAEVLGADLGWLTTGEVDGAKRKYLRSHNPER